MKVGTDGVLLGAWATIPERGRILDIGTGTGLIALMVAQRSAIIYIDAIEIEPSAVEQARENFSASPWSGRINLIEGDIFQYNPPHRYDAIICNPPFFINSLENPDPERRTARHWSDEFSHEALLRHVVTNLLAPNGTFALILPVTEAEKILMLQESEGLRLSRLTKVRPLPDRDPNRYLIEFASARPSTLNTHKREETLSQFNNESSMLNSPETSELTLYDAPGVRSSAYSALAKDFYL